MIYIAIFHNICGRLWI